ncbi:MAG TPA: hypothetical protein VH372_23975, partial [Actinospica sp.]|nr:hypothetical protein [Actinospica sp.]
QRVWWQLSSEVMGAAIREICAGWSCEIGDVLAPVAQRYWDDELLLEDTSIAPVGGYRLHRPQAL